MSIVPLLTSYRQLPCRLMVPISLAILAATVILTVQWVDRRSRKVAGLAEDPQLSLQVRATRRLLRIIEHGKSGYIDTEGNVVIAPAFDSAADDFSDGLAWIVRDGKFGFIDTAGNVVIEPKYSEARSFAEGLAAARPVAGGPLGYIDRSGTFVIGPEFDIAEQFKGGRARVGMQTLMSKIESRFMDAGIATRDYYIDRQGRPAAEGAAPPASDWTINETGGLYGYRGGPGHEDIPARFESAWPFTEGLAGVQVDHKWTFIDGSGALITSPQFDEVYPFSEGLAPVRLNGRWGYIDRTGTMVIDPQFDWAWPFDRGIARVALDRGIGYINARGQYIWQPRR